MRRMKNWPRKSDQVEDVDASENLKSGNAYERPRKGSQEEDVDEWWWWSQVRKKIDERSRSSWRCRWELEEWWCFEVVDTPWLSKGTRCIDMKGPERVVKWKKSTSGGGHGKKEKKMKVWRRRSIQKSNHYTITMRQRIQTERRGYHRDITAINEARCEIIDQLGTVTSALRTFILRNFLIIEIYFTM